MKADIENEAMVLTAPGMGAIAVVRLRGPGALPFLGRHFSRPVRPGAATHGQLRENDRLIDDPIVVVSENSDWADLNLHGGSWIVGRVLNLARCEGFQSINWSSPAGFEPGFDEIDSALEREVVGHLPLARTELAIRALLAQPAAWRERLSRIRDDSISDGLGLKAILNDRSLDWLLHPPRIAIIGVPNVGKSTLANQLFGQARSITADLPGTTRDWVEELANIDRLAVTLVDTPGMRQTDDPLERAAIARGREKIADSDLTILVLDATQSFEAQNALCLQWPGALKIINKVDRRAVWNLALIPATSVCALNGFGLMELRQEIHSFFGLANFDISRPRCWTQRQRNLLAGAVNDPGRLNGLGINGSLI